MCINTLTNGMNDSRFDVTPSQSVKGPLVDRLGNLLRVNPLRSCLHDTRTSILRRLERKDHKPITNRRSSGYAAKRLIEHSQSLFGSYASTGPTERTWADRIRNHQLLLAPPSLDVSTHESSFSLGKPVIMRIRIMTDILQVASNHDGRLRLRPGSCSGEGDSVIMRPSISRED